MAAPLPRDVHAALEASRRGAIRLVQEKGQKDTRELLRRAAEDLKRRLDRVERGPTGPDSYTAAKMRATLAHVREVQLQLGRGMKGVLLERGEEAAEHASEQTAKALVDGERAFRGVGAQPLALTEALMLDAATDGARGAILRRIAGDPSHPGKPGVLQRYGAEVVGNFERTLQLGLLQGKGWDEMREDITEQSPFLQGAPRHWAERIVRTECLPGDSLVTGAVVRAVFRRWYEGAMFEVVTESGRKLTTTPNHPVLTRRGWIGAQELKLGDDLVCHRRKKCECSPGDEDVDTRPSSLGEIFDSVSAISVGERRRGAKPDFHGDGRDGDVHVLCPRRMLRIGRFAALDEPTAKHVFTPSHFAASRFCGLCRRFLAVAQSVCCCQRAQRDAGLPDPILDAAHAGAVFLAELPHPFAGHITPYDFVGGQVFAEARMRSAVFLEELPGIGGAARDAFLEHDFPDEVDVDPESGGYSVTAKAGEIELDRVVSILIRVFAGHVYNLETSDGYFAVDGVYTGNCMAAYGRASFESVRAADDELGDMVKVLSATFDGRTGADSYDVHGQIRRPEEAFQSWFGLYQHPPNRPNDREVVLPHRISWPIPDHLLPRSDAEVAAAWSRNGRKGRPPARSKSTTVPREQFGRVQPKKERPEPRERPEEGQNIHRKEDVLGYFREHAEDRDDAEGAQFARATTEEIAEHFGVSTEKAYRMMAKHARGGDITKVRDVIKGRKREGEWRKAFGWQMWEHHWGEEDDDEDEG